MIESHVDALGLVDRVPQTKNTEVPTHARLDSQYCLAVAFEAARNGARGFVLGLYVHM